MIVREQQTLGEDEERFELLCSYSKSRQASSTSALLWL